MGKIYRRFSGKQEKREYTGMSASKFLLVTATLFLVAAIWQTAVLGLIFGILVSVIFLAATLFPSPLSPEEHLFQSDRSISSSS